MWPFSKAKRHLRYASIWEWKEKEGVPDDFIRHDDPALRDRWITEYGELRQHLFEQHLVTLGTDEQQLFKEQRHPSMSHRFDKQAEPYLISLKQELNLAGIRYESVCLGYYQMDRLVFSVDLETGQEIDVKRLPWLHRGFEIKFGYPQAE